MALFDTTWYVNFGNGSSTGYYAVTVRPQNTAVAAGVLRRQFTAPAVGSERVFVCIVAGTTANTTDATWTTTRGAKTTDGTATWQECTGAAAVNGDATNTPTWTGVTGGSATAITLGAIIKRNNGASYWICSTAGTTSTSEPAWANDNAGTTRTDNTVTWTCLGVVGNFSGGGAPHARIANCATATWFAANNTMYVGDNHAETQSTAISISPAGANTTALGRILCHNHSGSYPPASGDLTTGATVTTSAAVNITLTATGMLIVDGVTFQVGSGASGSCFFVLAGSSAGVVIRNSSLQVLTTGPAAGCIQLGNSASVVSYTVLDNTTVKFGGTAGSINIIGGQLVWKNTASALASGSSTPTNLFNLNQIGGWGELEVEGVDVSAVTNLVSFANRMNGRFVFKNCKVNASVTNSTPTDSGSTIDLINCDSGATTYMSGRWKYEGTETTETTITRQGSTADPNGQLLSRKIVTTANAQWQRSFFGKRLAQWNTIVDPSTLTVTVYGTINAGAVPNNDEIWIEVVYLGSSGSPLGTIVNTTKANVLASGSAVSSDSSTWNGGGSGGGWSPFKLVATLSSPKPQFAGPVEVRAYAAKASTTYYLDAVPALS